MTEFSEISPEIRERLLRESLDNWRNENLISEEQHKLLLARISATAPSISPEVGRGVTILINLGAVALAAGLIIFFASNWIEFGRAAKIGSLFALTLFFYLVGFEL